MGVQATAAVFEEDIIRSKVKLNAFGNLTSSCTMDTFAPGEYLTNWTFHYVDYKVIGLTYETSDGHEQILGLQQLSGSKNFGFIFT